MRSRFAALVAMMTILASIGGTALAAPPASGPDCTFANGKTTCVTTEITDYYIVRDYLKAVHDPVLCPPDPEIGDTGPFVTIQNMRTDEITTTTTVYRGKSRHVLSSDTRTEESQPYPVGKPYSMCFAGLIGAPPER